MTKDQDYETAVEKGTKLLKILTEKTKAPLQSEFKHAEELAQHGYRLEPQQTDFEIECVAEALRDLNVDERMVYDGGKNVRIHHIHNNAEKIEGEEYYVRHDLSYN
jgi:hypothetical protein